MDDFPWYVKARGKSRLTAFIVKKLETNQQVSRTIVITLAVLQIRRGNRDNLGINSYISP